MKTVEEALSQIDEPKPPRRVWQLTAVLDRSIQELDPGGAQEGAYPLTVDREACAMVIRNAVLADDFEGKNGTEPRLGDSLSATLTTEHKDYLLQRAMKTKNPVLKAHYCDLLFEAAGQDQPWKSRRPELAQKAVEAYLGSARLFAAPGNLGDAMVDSLDHAAYLAMTMSKSPGCGGLLTDVVAGTTQQLEQEAAREQAGPVPAHTRGRWVADLARLLARIRLRYGAKFVSDESMDAAESACRVFADLSDPNHPWDEMEFRAVLRELAESRGDSAAAYLSRREQIRAMENLAERRASGIGGDPLAAGGILAQAIQGYEKLAGDPRVEVVERARLIERIDSLRPRVRDFYREGRKRFVRIEAPLDISTDEVKSMISDLLQPEDLHDCLTQIISEGSLLPNLELVEEQARDLLKEPGLMQRIPATLLSDDIPVAQVAASQEEADSDTERSNQSGVRNSGQGQSEDPRFAWERDRLLLLWIGINSEVILHQLFEALRDEKGLNAESLLEYFDKWGLLDEDNRDILCAGLERYFSGDGIGAVHIMAPQFEDVFRTLLDRAGAFVVQRRRRAQGWQFESNLRDMIDLPQAQGIPREIREYIRLVLCDPSGWNLRNRVAHGLITPAQCSLPMVETVLHLFLLLTLMQAPAAAPPAEATPDAPTGK